MRLINLNQLAILANDQELIFEANQDRNDHKWTLTITPQGGGSYTFSAINSAEARRFAKLDTLRNTIIDFYSQANLKPPDIIIKS